MTSDNIPNSNPVGNEDSGDESESIPLAQIDTLAPTPKKRKSTKNGNGATKRKKRLVIKDEDDDEPLALKSPVKAKKPKTKLNGKIG